MDGPYVDENVPVNGTLQSVTVGVPPMPALLDNTLYCYDACLTDVTAGTPEECAEVQAFATPNAPEVITDPAFNVGAWERRLELNTYLPSNAHPFSILVPHDRARQLVDALWLLQLLRAGPQPDWLLPVQYV